MKKLYLVGIGPGDREGMTVRALAALSEAEVHCGYSAYLDLTRPLFPDKETLSGGMRQEVERCRAALAAAAGGKTTALICSGDPGVYGMAGLVYQLAGEFEPVDIETVPGVSAAMSGAALLGAPLMHDFAVVSLSDLLTPWETIALRLDAAARADFVLVLYNPSSHKRSGYLGRAGCIVSAHRSPETVCGWVRNAGRDGEESGVLTLAELADFQADMFTTVFIGNRDTRLIGGKMVTPRGYRGVE